MYSLYEFAERLQACLEGYSHGQVIEQSKTRRDECHLTPGESLARLLPLRDPSRNPTRPFRRAGESQLGVLETEDQKIRQVNCAWGHDSHGCLDETPEFNMRRHRPKVICGELSPRADSRISIF